MRRATYGVLGFLIAALIVAVGLREREPVPEMYVAEPPLPSVPPTAVRIEELDRTAVLKLAAESGASLVGVEALPPTVLAVQEAAAWAR